jgi:mono/diheme cytochrome c family protein
MKSLVCAVFAIGLARMASAAPDPAALFTRKCSSCHTYGRGDLVGPDLKGATDRHTRGWLTAWITSSETVIRSGDQAANVLFKKYKQTRMPDQSFAPADLAALIDFLAAGGPEEEARRRNRRADTATAPEIELGRRLFAGERTLAGGGAACSACHQIRSAGFSGGSLGPDLSHAYARYQDKSLATLLARGCFPRVPDSAGRKPLTDDENFALRAFISRAEPADRRAVAVVAGDHRE